MSILDIAEKLLPASRRIVEALRSDDENARAQKMALIAFAIRVASAGIAFLSQIIQARLMGEYEYGIFVFVWVMVILSGNLSCIGFPSAVIRFLPGYRVSESHGEIRGLALTARIFAMSSATIIALLGFAGLGIFESSIDHYYIVPIFLGLVTLPMIALGDVLDGTARANSWAIAAFSQTYIIRPSLTLIFMVLAVQFGRPATAVTAMQSALAATYVTSLGQFIGISWRLRKRYSTGPIVIDFPAWIRVALPIFLIDGFGVYFAAAKTMALVQFVFFSVKAAAGTRFSSLIAETDRVALGNFAAKTARWTFWPSLVLGLFVLAVGKLLLALFGPSFTEGYPLMAIFFAGMLAKAIVGPGEVLLTMAGRQRLCAALYAGILGVNIVLNIICIPLFGLAGAAMAVALATLVEAILLHVTVRRTLGITLFAFARQTPPSDQAKAFAS